MDLPTKVKQLRNVIMDRLDSVKNVIQNTPDHAVDDEVLIRKLRIAACAAMLEEGINDGTADVCIRDGKILIRIAGTIRGTPFDFGG